MTFPKIKVMAQDPYGEPLYGPVELTPYLDGDVYRVKFEFTAHRIMRVAGCVVVFPWGANVIKFDDGSVKDLRQNDTLRVELKVWEGMIPQNSAEAEVYADFLRPGSDMSFYEFEDRLDQIHRLGQYQPS